MSDTTEITAGEIEAATKEAAPPADVTPRQQTQDSTENPPASATETPVVTEKPEDRYKGWIPPDAHKRIVDGFHSRFDEIAWARGLKRDEVEEALALRRQINERSRESANAEPQPDVKDERGELFYSPQQAAKWAKWQAQQEVAALRAEMEERYGPIESTFAEHQRMNAVVEQMDSALALPGADEFVKDMAAWVTDINDRRANGERLPQPTAMDAYVAVVPKRLQERGTASEAEIRKRLMKEINDTTERVTDDVNPSRVPAASHKKDSEKSIKELLEEEYNRRATA